MLIKPDNPFYKNPTLWIIILLPSLTVIMGIVFFTFSVLFNDSAVVDDYYKKGKEINRVLERDIWASDNQISATIRLDNDKKLAFVDIGSDQKFTQDQHISIKFIHRTLKAEDRELVLIQEKDNQYYAVLPLLHPGRWLIEMGNEQWRLKGQATLPEEVDIQLVAK